MTDQETIPTSRVLAAYRRLREHLTAIEEDWPSYTWYAKETAYYSWLDVIDIVEQATGVEYVESEEGCQ